MLKPILLIEDDQNDLELTMMALKKFNVANLIITIRDGEEVMDYISGVGNWAKKSPELPALILLDKKLPKMDGHEIAMAIRADPQLHMTPIVMFTSSRQESEFLKSYEKGVNAYVVKPLVHEDFLNAVGYLVNFWTKINEPYPGKIG